MSWLTGLAGKAESLLNNLDQSAAVLVSPDSQGSGLDSVGLEGSAPYSSPYRSSSSSDYHHTRSGSFTGAYRSKTDPHIVPMYEPQTLPVQTAIQNRSAPSSVVRGGEIKSPAARIGGEMKASVSDADLLNFLNSPSMPPRPSSLTDGDAERPADQGIAMDPVGGSEAGSSGYYTVEGGVDMGARVPQTGGGGGGAELENKMLRSEVSSLSQEVSSLLQRNHRSEEEVKRLRTQVEKVQNQLKEADKRFRAASSRCDDAEETLRVRETQIAAMGADLERAQLEQEKLKAEISRLDYQHSATISDHSSSQQTQSYMVEEMKSSITRLEQELHHERDTLTRTQRENDVLKRNVDEFKLKEVELLRTKDSSLMDEKRRHQSLLSQIDVLKQKHQNLQRELKDYKEKATKILQMKEKVISSLKGESPLDSVDDQAGSNESTSEEAISVRAENALLREEVQRCRVEMERRECDMEDLEREMGCQSESLRRNIDLLEEQLDREKQLRQDSESELSQSRRELQLVQERSLRQRTESSEQVAQRDAEVSRLRSMLTLKSSQTEGQVEMEERLRAVTEKLIQKQSLLDTLKAEKHSLQVKLERTEMEVESLTRMQISSNSDQTVRSSGGHREDFLRISMQDPPLTRNVKSAVNTMDAFSIRLGSFMRRYPPARLFMLGYTFLLHLWVFFVIVTYQPEIHSSLNPAAQQAPQMPAQLNVPAPPKI